ncbi:zinc finger protein ZPR1 [Orussus abietinus]|uniref:zinc finger protein ZPR1 n=1 Tax=Orussus abietinus TaxID=222816 RepID=UPI000625C5F9|nr:zinc finger protein ZPR1 [Orussus abietinus]
MAGNEIPTKSEDKKPIFRNLAAEDSESEINEIESLCMNCGQNGITRLLLTKIPHYKDVIIMSFDCEFCGYQNNELQNGGKVADKGVRITLNVSVPRDLNRQVVKSDYTMVRIPHLDFEIPALSQKGEVTTIEGIIDKSIAGLEQDQPVRRKENEASAVQIDLFLSKLRSLKLLKEPFVIIFEDISGNCHVENPETPLKDKSCEVKHFKRTKDQDRSLGIYYENEDALLKPVADEDFTLEQLQGEVLTFPTNCPACNSPCETNMKMTNIPHFKEVVIMATNCDICGNRTNEVKSGGGIEPQGIKMEITITGKEDFGRDLLKSETCNMEIPELEMEVGSSTLGGRFTTVEGIIVAIKEQLTSSTTLSGDSCDPNIAKRMDDFIAELEEILKGNKKVTLVLDDPAGNSFIQSLSEDGPDERLKITKYERSFSQNDELGLNDMKVENYEN